jgi:hypothetical protein
MIARSLAKYYIKTEIEDFEKQALDALLSRSTTTIHVSTMSQGGESSSGIVLSTPQQQRDFIETAQAAIRIIDGDDEVLAEDMGPGIDFSQKPVAT